MQRQILKTTRLFTMNPAKPESFHSYIQNVSNFILVVKTDNGAYLAAISEGSYAKKEAGRRGLLLSLSNQKAFQLQKGKQALTFDESFLIFGNTDLRLDPKDMSVVSSLGSVRGYYSSPEGSYRELLGTKEERKAKVAGLEVYEDQFK
jgi:hypothetical protein